MLTFGYGQKVQASSSGKMTIYAIDLGKWNSGEATMISSGSGDLLIDTGDRGSDNIFYWLDSHRYKKKCFNLLITHWHEDHAGNASRLINDYNIRTAYILSSGSDSDGKRLFNKLADAARKNGTKIVYLKKRQTISIGAGVDGRVLYVNGSPAYENSDDVQLVNNQSAVIMFSGGRSKFLAAGDIQREAETRILNSGESLRADIFKLSHHGHPGSNTREFVKKIMPTYAWFTTHDDTPSYYCPLSVYDCVRRMSSTSNVFSTRYNGTTVFQCAGGKITVSAERNTNVMYRRIRNKKTGNEKLSLLYSITRACRGLQTNWLIPPCIQARR